MNYKNTLLLERKGKGNEVRKVFIKISWSFGYLYSYIIWYV